MGPEEAPRASPYRDPDAPPPDRESAAVAIVEKRIRRTRALLVTVAVLAILPLAVAGYLFVQEVQFAMNGVAFVYLNAALGVGVPFIGMFKLTDMFVPRIMGALAKRWVHEVAEAHGVPVESLAEYFTLLQ